VTSRVSVGDQIPPNCELIEVHVTDLRQLFNPIDPSPPREKDLDSRAEEFIVSWARASKRDAQLALLVEVDTPERPDEAATVRDAARLYLKGDNLVKVTLFPEKPVASEGGVPIVVDDQIVGAVGVSGAASAQQDEELAMAGARAFESGPPPVSYFPKEAVKAGFAKGIVLFDQSDKYMVHTSRREQPGMAEIHTKDADIVYVLDGTAALITGGTPIGVKPIGNDELRGERIDGGEVRQLAKGDVIIVPAGVPHWFKEVTNPFLYYVVKAR